MKNKILMTVVLCGGMCLTSCDDYLDIEPKGTALLKTTEDYLGLLEEVNPTYDQGDFWTLSGESSWYKLEELKNYTVPLRSAAYLWDESYDRAGNTINSELYNNCYSRITNYNAIISNVMSSDGNEDDKKLAMAQAKIMRAYNYFFLVNTFARPYDPATADTENGIIVREKMFESIEEEGVQQTVGYTYKLIQQDIDDAINDLPHEAVNVFRPDRTFGLALKAKVHLYKREIGECIAACEDALAEAAVAGHELHNMNTVAGPVATYLISAYGTDRAIDDPMYMGVNDIIERMWKENIKYDYDDSENLLYQFGTTYTDPYPMYVTKAVIDLFEKDADLRYRCCIKYKATHSTAPEGDCEFGTLSIKWNPAGMRLSEVYLMLAECYARKGGADNIAKAMYYLETLRGTRLLTGKYQHLTATTAEEAMRHVREERKRELFMTYNGFFDMRRFCTEFNETLTKELDGKTYTLAPTSHLLTFPFSLKAMQTSKLTQNSK